MTSGIHINISGGTSNLGSVVQGDGVIVSSGNQSVDVQMNSAFSKAYNELEEARAEDSTVALDKELVQLKADLVELKKAMEKGEPGRWASFGDAAKTIYEKYGWAAVPLKTLFSVLIPGWIPG